MTTPLKISARNAGQVELEKYCPRCCWYLLRIKKLPFQFGMPGIMFYMEQVEKAFITAHIDTAGCLPKSFGPFSECTEVVSFPFSMEHEHETGVIVTARPDMILRLPDDSLALIDLKTAKSDGGGKIFLPQYCVQCIGYSWVATEEGIGNITKTGLIYAEIQRDSFLDDPLDFEEKGGIYVPFKFTPHEIPLDFDRLTRCLREVKKLWENGAPPEGTTGCKDCALFNRLVDFEESLRLTDRRAMRLLPESRNHVISQDYLRRAARGLSETIQKVLDTDDFLENDGGHWATWDFTS